MNNTLKILLISSLISVVFYFTFGLGNTIFNSIPPDTLTYIDASNMLYDEMKPHPTRPLGFAFITGIPKIIYPSLSINNYITFGIIINLLAWMGSIILFYKSLRIYFTNRISYLFSLVLIFTFSGIAHVFWMLTEPLVSFIISLITYNLLKYSRNQKAKYLIISTSLLNLSTLIKPGFFYLGIFASLGLITFLLYNHKGIGFKKVFSFFIISIILIAIQNISIYRNYERFTPSFIDKLTWYHCLGAESYAVANDTSFKTIKESRRLDLSEKSFKEISQQCKDDLKEQMMNHPHIIFKEWILNMAENSISGSSILKVIAKGDKNRLSSTFSKLLYIITSFLNFFFILIYLFSVIIILRDFFRYNFAIILLATLVAYVILTSGISFWQGDRFHYILYPTIIVIFLLLIKDKAYAQQWLKQH